ncbi:MAG: drug/metabolite transporter (DMT)-like permease [Paracoccaceae bacterium]|jgi:drug/metabolite transporter (DMT)-like permease
MTTQIFLVVIAAAILHAVWNASIKDSGDKFVNMAAVILGQAPLAALTLLFVPIPVFDSLPYLLVGIALHIGYQFFLPLSYKYGDLTLVYPIARGVAPLIVAGISVLFLGVELNTVEIIGVLTIGTGIMSLALVRKSDGQRNGKAVGLALITGCFIASYSLVDGTGARIAGTAIGFYGLLALGSTLGYSVILSVWKPGTLRLAWRSRKLKGLLGGSASFIAFSLVIWAFTQAPIALVTALRETSIIFALLIGVFVLKEKLDLMKVVSTMITVGGAIIMKFSKH